VLYAGTFSKVLFPGIGLAYLVVPEAQVERFERISQIFSGGGPELTQAIVTTFLTEGHFARHIQRMRKLYAERRGAAAKGLEEALGTHMRVDPQPGAAASLHDSHGLPPELRTDWPRRPLSRSRPPTPHQVISETRPRHGIAAIVTHSIAAIRIPHNRSGGERVIRRAMDCRTSSLPRMIG